MPFEEESKPSPHPSNKERDFPQNSLILSFTKPIEGARSCAIDRLSGRHIFVVPMSRLFLETK